MSINSIIPDDELNDNMTSFNAELLELFVIENGYQKSYIEKFLKSKRNGNKEFFEYTSEDVLNHIVMLNLYKASRSYYENYKNHLRALKRTAISNYNDKFGPDFLSDVDESLSYIFS